MDLKKSIAQLISFRLIFFSSNISLVRVFILIIISMIAVLSYGQDTKPDRRKVYRLNYKVDVPITVGMFALNFYGLHLISEKPNLTVEQVNDLKTNDIWSFDRSAVLQSYSLDKSELARNMSDWGLWISYCLPALIFIDDEIRKDWYDVLLLYLETQAINLNVYYFGGPVFTERVRPLVYYPETSMEYKLSDEGTTDSFFSGHASMTAGAFFFMAKVYSDYHPELGAKKWILYAAALIPPAFVGFYRFKGLMHFPTDILLGTAIGAGVGVLIPQLHKVTEMNENLSIVPFTGGYSGVAIALKF